MRAKLLINTTYAVLITVILLPYANSGETLDKVEKMNPKESLLPQLITFSSKLTRIPGYPKEVQHQFFW